MIIKTIKIQVKEEYLTTEEKNRRKFKRPT